LSHLEWNKARLTLLSQFILALIKTRSVNLTEIAVAFEGKAQVSSNYKRLQRFLRSFEINFDTVAKLILVTKTTLDTLFRQNKLEIW